MISLKPKNQPEH